MSDTYQQLWNKVLLRCPSLSPKLAQDFIVSAFRRLAEVRRWSWLVRSGQFIAPAVYNTGTVAVTQNYTTITGTATAWDASLVGRQFRTGLVAPIYTITQVNSPTSLELDAVWGGITATAQAYSIYQCFFTAPLDFHQFISLYDPAYNWQLHLDVQQSEINIWDAQRANIGSSYVVSFRDYTTSQVGIVQSTIQVVGAGAVPVSGGIYTAPADAIFTVIITLGGASGTAEFKWSKNTSAYTTGVVTDINGAGQVLQDGLQISFPTAATYVLGDTFIIRASAIANAGVPRYELWPHQQDNHVYPFLYEARAQDLSDTNAVLPRYIRGDVIVDMALEDVSLWPGVSDDKPNPYYSLANAQYYGTWTRKQIEVLEVQDDNVYEQDLTYAYPSMAWAMATPLGDSRFLQSHAV